MALVEFSGVLFRAEGAGQLGLVLEAGADGALSGVLGGCDRGRGLADRDGLIGAARDGCFVVGVAGVGGHPVVGARRRRAGAVEAFILAVGTHGHGAVAGDRGAFAAVVVIELEGDRAAHVFAEGAGFFFNDTAATEIYTLSLLDALPI